MKILGFKQIFVRAITILTVMVALIGMIACSSEEPTVDEIQTTSSSIVEVSPQPEKLAYKVNEDGKTCTITGKGTCISSDIVIPSAIDGYQVTVIGERAFARSAITSVTIPNSVTTIDEYAFSGNDHLTSIEIPNSVTSIGWGAFQGCSGFKTIVIPDSVTGIGSFAFAYCSNLESITLPFSGNGDLNNSVGDFGIIFGGNNIDQKRYVPKSLKTIVITNPEYKLGLFAFASLENIEHVVLPEGITEIPIEAFYNCKNLKSITIPDSVKSIGTNAFYGCSNLIQEENGFLYVNKWVIGPDKYNSPHTLDTLRNDTVGICDKAFYDCAYLENIALPDSLKCIGNSAFACCRNLTSIAIPDSVSYIGYAVFKWCYDLESIILPNGITNIRFDTFSYCSSLRSIVIPNSVKCIESMAFDDSGLCTIYYGGTVEEWTDITVEGYDIAELTSATRYYYSETQPTTEGKYWRYVDGVPTRW